jgi:hypothetical protein
MQKRLSQKETLNNELTNIREDISDKDKRDFKDAHGVTLTTISGYLNGKAASIELALKMLLFFREKIAARAALINETKVTEKIK